MAPATIKNGSTVSIIVESADTCSVEITPVSREDDQKEKNTMKSARTTSEQGPVTSI